MRRRKLTRYKILWTDSNQLTDDVYTTVFEAFNFGVNAGSTDFKIVDSVTGEVASHYIEEEEELNA